MREGRFPLFMSRTPYPCWGLSLQEPIEDTDGFISTFLSWRENENWLLLGAPAAVSETQLWTAWLGLNSRHANGTMRANSIDVEFLRLIAGTHQIKIGFQRAGLHNGDQQLWLIHIPECNNEAIIEMQWPDLDRVGLDREANRLMCALNAKLIPHVPMPHEKSVARLELEVEDQNASDFNSIERAALAHIALADLN